MDASERTRLRVLHEAATPGPWASESRGIVEGPDTSMVAVCGGRPTKDAALIVGAVNALPALLDDADAADARIAKAERERDEARAETADLRATVDTMQVQLDAHREWLATAQATGDEARAEAERLRAAVNEALLIAHTAPPPVHAAHWCLRLVETLHNALKTDGAP